MNKEKIDRFFSGHSTDEEQQQVYQWLLSRNMEHEANALLKNHWDSIEKSSVMVDVDFDKVYGRILEEIENEQVMKLLGAEVKPEIPETPKMEVFKSILKYAAIIVFAFGLGYFAYDQNKYEQEGLADKSSNIVKATSRGQKSHVILKDGSKITLNSESQIKYDQGFGTTNRDVKLTGEAYFEVAKNVAIPFNVEANNTITTAIGTAFNISAFPMEESTVISLASGKVKVLSKGKGANSDSEVFLDPGKEYLVAQGNTGALLRGFDPEKVLSWKDNILNFDNTDMPSLIQSLERWYNVEVVVLNPQKMVGIRGTGKFKNESLENVLRVLSYSLQFDYQMDRDKVTITF
ncbi:MAG: DUF4974 domain-containing protein [Cyclobacteriaceae bacterium]